MTLICRVHLVTMLAFSTGAVIPAMLSAQQPAPLAAGTVVQWIDAPSGGRHIEGVVTSASPDSIFVQVINGPAYRISPSANPSLMVRGDRHPRTRNALVGAAIGAGAGLIIGVATRTSGCDSYFGCGYESDGRYVGASILGGALWGVLIGALLTPSWQWHPRNGATSVSVKPNVLWQHGLVVGVQIRR